MLKTVAKAFALEVDFGYVDYFEAMLLQNFHIFIIKLQNPPLYGIWI